MWIVVQRREFHHVLEKKSTSPNVVRRMLRELVLRKQLQVDPHAMMMFSGSRHTMYKKLHSTSS